MPGASGSYYLNLIPATSATSADGFILCTRTLIPFPWVARCLMFDFVCDKINSLKTFL